MTFMQIPSGWIADERCVACFLKSVRSSWTSAYSDWMNESHNEQAGDFRWGNYINLKASRLHHELEAGDGGGSGWILWTWGSTLDRCMSGSRYWTRIASENTPTCACVWTAAASNQQVASLLWVNVTRVVSIYHVPNDNRQVVFCFKVSLRITITWLKIEDDIGVLIKLNKTLQ